MKIPLICIFFTPWKQLTNCKIHAEAQVITLLVGFVGEASLSQDQ